MNDRYPGTELELFAQARNWKSYIAGSLRPWLGPRVLEVGAGIGGNIPTMFTEPVREWTALEPDPTLAARIEGASRVVIGTIEALDSSEEFDAVLYLDVLEHISEDHKEVERALTHVAPGGRLIVLAPAHMFLFTPFDAAIGHYRRYNKRTLGTLPASDVTCAKLSYLDSVGLIASAANRFLLRSATPTPAQIAVWDRIMVPSSRWLDPLLVYSVGKSILGVWCKRRA